MLRRRSTGCIAPSPCFHSRRATRFLDHRHIVAIVLAAAPSAAWALVTGEVADRVADVLAVVVLIFAPLAGIYLFWKLHILPEEIAARRNHPQKDAIRALCLLSLIFGGLLWPIALIWAYTRPALHKLAYETEELEQGHEAAAEKRESRASTQSAQEDRLAAVRNDIDQLSHQGAPPEDVELLKRDFARIEQKLAPRREVR